MTALQELDPQLLVTQPIHKTKQRKLSRTGCRTSKMLSIVLQRDKFPQKQFAEDLSEGTREAVFALVTRSRF